MKTKTGIYTIIIFFSAVSIFVIVFLIYPALRDIENSSKEILSNKEGLNFINAQNAELDNFKKNYKDYEPNLKKTEQLFVNPKNPISLIEFLEKMASNLNIVTEIHLNYPANNENSNKTIATEFQISAKGNFLDILKFSEKVETGPYLIKINNLTIKKLDQNLDNAKNSDNLVEANFLAEAMNQ